MVSKTGPNPEDVLVTSHVEGLDKARRQAGRYMGMAVFLAILVGATFAVTLAEHEPWPMVLAYLFFLSSVFACAILGGMFVGRYSAFRDLAQGHAKATQVMIDEEEQ